MHVFRYVIILIVTILFFFTCDKQKKGTENNDPANKSFSSVSLKITKQTEVLYRTAMRNSGNKIDVYTAGAFDLQQVEAPGTFRELVSRLQKDWAVPSQDFSHPVIKFLVALHAKSPLCFGEGAIRQRNLKSYFLAYSLLTGELRTNPILGNLKKNLGKEFSLYIDDPDLKIEWSDDCSSLILGAKNKLKTIPVVPGENLQPQYNQKVKSVAFTSEEIKLMEREYRGSVQLMDNALGKIYEVFVFYNQYLPYKTLLSICRTLDARIHIVTLPQSQLMHYVDMYIQTLEKGKCEKSFLESILKQQSYLSGGFKSQIESMCKEDCGKLMEENRSYYLARWKKLQEKMFREEADTHEQNLRKRLQSDGIDLQRISIVTSQHLECQWARDYFFLGFAHDGKPLFLESSIQLIKRNKTLAKELARASELKRKWGIQDIHLPFEGGDIRAVGQSMFMGENTFERGIDEIQRIIGSHGKIRLGSNSVMSTDRTGIALHLKKEYEALFGREFILVGEGDTSPQSMMHIDMFLTFLPNPGKKPTVVVADMNETLTLLNGLSDEEIAQIERSMLRASLRPDELNRSSPFWLYQGLFMRHDLIQILLHGGLQRYIRAYQKSKKRIELQQQLDAVATWFKERGFSVVRAPTAALPLCYINFWSQRNGTAILGTIQDNAYRVYNNVLVEMYLDNQDSLHRTVYMPQYGITPLEKRLMEIYNDLGYRVVFIPFMWEPAYGRGGLDCLTTEIRGLFREKKD